MADKVIIDTPNMKLAQKYCEKFNAAARARQPFEREWYTNLAFYFGKHYVQWNRSVTSGGGVSFYIPKAPEWRVRAIINRLKPIIRKEIAKMNKEDPDFWILPDSPDDLDIAAARMAHAAVEELLTSGTFRSKKMEALFWTAVCGTGFLKSRVEGDEISYVAPSPFHIWIPSIEVQEIEEQEFVCHGISMHPDKVQEIFGATVEADLPETSESKFLISLGITQRQEQKTTAFIKEFWVKPCKDFPEGAMFVIGNKGDHNDIIYMTEKPLEIQKDPETGLDLKDESGNPVMENRIPSNIPAGATPKLTYPYAHGQYPFAKIGHILTGRFYTESVLVDLIPIQKEYNKNRSQTIEARNLTAKPQWAVAKGSVETRKITAMPGLIIEYTPGFEAPAPIKNPELPSYVMQDLQTIVGEMEFVSNQYEITQGRTPPGVEAASAISFLMEENDSILEPTIDSLEMAVQKMGQQSITLIRDYWPDDKKIRVIGANQIHEVLQFNRTMFQKNLQFHVVPGSMQPRSRAAKQAFIMELINNGTIPPVEGLQYLDMTEINRLYNDLQIDQRQVERENFKMSNGMPVPTNEFDNDEIHLVGHGRFLKSQRFELLTPEIQQIHLAHYQEHLMKLGMQTVQGGTAPQGPETQEGELNAG